MSSALSLRGRRIVGHLGPRSDLLPALAAVCAEHEVRQGTVTGVGRLSAASLRRYDEATGSWRAGRRIDGSLELLSLLGTVGAGAGRPALDLRAVMLSSREGHEEIVGGALEAAMVSELAFAIDASDDVTASATTPATGAGTSAGPVSWDEVAAASLEAEAAPAADADAQPVRVTAGDIIDHPRFSRCTVYKVEGDYEFVKIALRNGRLIRLSLDVVELSPVGTENGQRIFQAKIG